MKCYLDSNVLIYFKQENSPFFTDAENILLELMQEDISILISTLTLDEVLLQLRNILVLEKTAHEHIYVLLDNILKDLLSLPNLRIINPPTEKRKQKKILKFMHRYKLRPRDAYHLLTMQEYGISLFATFDKDFKDVFRKNVIKRYKPS